NRRMGQELAGKVAIVTGGAGGIGRGIVELFMEEGAKVVIADVDAPAGEALVAEVGATAAFKQTDVGDADQVQELVDFTVAHFGGLHVMCNNAGISGSRRRFLDDDLGPLLHEELHDPATDAAGAAGDDRDLARKLLAHASMSSRPVSPLRSSSPGWCRCHGARRSRRSRRGPRR